MTRTAGVSRGLRNALAGLRPVVAFVLASTACARLYSTSEPAEPVPSASASSITQADVVYFRDHSLMVPVDGVSPRELRDSFNDARDNGRTHRALDILAPRGTPILAAISGQVIRLSQSSAGGTTAYLTDDEGQYIYYYAHLDHYSDQLTAGLRVGQGFVIGYVGTSGNAPPDTPHLHFQVMRYKDGQRDWWNSPPVDVRSFMTIKGRKIE